MKCVRFSKLQIRGVDARADPNSEIFANAKVISYKSEIGVDARADPNSEIFATLCR